MGLSDRPVVPALIAAMQDFDLLVSEASLTALTRIGPTAAPTLLAEF